MSLSATHILSGLRAAGEATRLRLLVLLAQGELTVKDLTRILGQSQPRISRHLKLLVDAGLVDRFSEGSWGYFRLADGTSQGQLARMIVSAADLNDPEISRDLQRCAAVKAERSAAAQKYFEQHASDWDTIRQRHADDTEIEAAILDAVGSEPVDLFVDIGTGTGRMLELCASRFRRGIGIDLNQAMLAYARANLDRAEFDHCQVRQSDLFNLPIGEGEADIAVLHQVLHFLDDPLSALREAARILKPSGIMLIVDYAPHELEFLRDEHAHQRLGFSTAQMQEWATEAGLTLSPAKKFIPPPRNRSSSMQDDAPLTVQLWTAMPTDQNGRVTSTTATPALSLSKQ